MLVKLTEHGVVMPRHLVSASNPMVGCEGSMLWKFDGSTLRIVWFSNTRQVVLDVDRGVVMRTKPFKTYEQIKNRRAERARAKRREA